MTATAEHATRAAARIAAVSGFVFAGLFFVDSSRYQILVIPDAGPLRQASLALIFAFGGFENASVPTEEVKNPTRNLPIALIASIAVTTLLQNKWGDLK